MSKWYLSCLTALAKGQIRLYRNLWDRICIVGYEPGGVVGHVVAIIQDLLRKGYEWKADFSVIVFQGDVLAAFDNLSLNAIERALNFGVYIHR